MELVAEAEWLITTKNATHVLIDGIQNSIPDIIRGTLNLETDVQQRLKALNKRALVVLTEVLYCPEHQQYEDTLHLRAITGYGFSLRDMVKLSIQDIAISTVTITSQD